MVLQILAIILGIVVLYFGGELLVRYSTALASALGVSPLVIGLTVVAFGTSAPELAAGIVAALQDSPGIAIGNVVGSNIANIGLILGLTVIITSLPAERHFVRREVPFMIATSALLVPFLLLGELARWQGVILLSLLGLFLYVQKRAGDLHRESEQFEATARAGTFGALLGSLVGLVLLVAGAQALVWGAVGLARGVGVSERVIGLTVVAFGTSVPELAGCLVAAARREIGLVLGNVIGSNIFNVLGILGTVVLIHPLEADFATFGLDVLVMLAFSVLLLFFFLNGHRLSRWEGVVLVCGYAGYIALLALQPEHTA
jgi:cation:H+ antiporter